MRLKHSIVFILIFFVALSCKKEQPTYESFPQEISLLSDEMTITEDIYMRYPFRVRLIDFCLFITDLHASRHYLHQFEYPSMKFIRSFAKRGEAPNEFLDAENIRSNKQPGIWLLDANKKKIVKIDYKSNDTICQSINLSEQLVRTLDFDFFNDSTVIVPDYTGKNRFCLVNMDGEVIKNSYQIPCREEKKNDVSDMALAQAWRSFIDYNEENGILAMATQLGQVLEIYDLKADTLINVCSGKNGAPRYELVEGYAVPSGIMGYSDVYVGSENIYALFWGYSLDEIKKNEITQEGGRYIHVFDLNGNPLIEYTLDRYITGFYVDEKRKKIIALDVNSDQPVVEYSF